MKLNTYFDMNELTTEMMRKNVTLPMWAEVLS